jgi:hypothetical protein
VREQSSGQAALLPDLSGAAWRKSSRSNAEGGECVEIAAAARGIAVRDSKNPRGPILAIDPGPWRTFLQVIKEGAHDFR